MPPAYGIIYIAVQEPAVHLEEYRSGRNGPDSKSGWVKAHVGSNPTSSAKLRLTGSVGVCVCTSQCLQWLACQFMTFPLRISAAGLCAQINSHPECDCPGVPLCFQTFGNALRLPYLSTLQSGKAHEEMEAFQQSGLCYTKRCHCREPLESASKARFAIYPVPYRYTGIRPLSPPRNPVVVLRAFI